MRLKCPMGWLLAITCFALTGCVSSKRSLNANAYDHAVRVACVGDSITYGAGLEHRETNSYPANLGRLLGSRFEVRNFGVSGATLLKKGDKPYWSFPEFTALNAFAPDAIVLKLGTNDSKPQNWIHGDEFAGDLRQMLDSLAHLPSKPRLWVCLPV